MPYLDDNEQFFDYRTSKVDGNNIFDTNRTGMSHYDNFITDPSYMEKSKNLKAEIVQMTPREYFEGCAKIFNSTVNKQISQTQADKQTIMHLMDVLNIYQRRFPITFLNYAQQSQEGRHRMLAAAQYCGWEVKHPVMVITWADEEKHQRQVKAEKDREIYIKLKGAVNNALRYEYKLRQEFTEELQYHMNTAFGEIGEPDVEFNVTYTDDTCTVTYDGVEYQFSTDSIKIDDNIEYEIEDDILLDDEEDLDAWLQEYLK